MDFRSSEEFSGAKDGGWELKERQQFQKRIDLQSTCSTSKTITKLVNSETLSQNK